jgi:hypothetical protein
MGYNPDWGMGHLVGQDELDYSYAARLQQVFSAEVVLGMLLTRAVCRTIGALTAALFGRSVASAKPVINNRCMMIIM